MSPFSVVPVVVGALWLVHAFLAITGSRAYGWTRWILLAGLPLWAVMLAVTGGMVGFAVALITVLTWLGVGFLEVFLVMGTTVYRDAKTRKGSDESAKAEAL
ncbi:hypothetical protein NIBR502772_19595 [Pseudarthrobacter sp. NIBRBAC000502772]|uniref:hypothetical protein n=1 Tax=Pseudarthrobacter sp. NIBRBAC000502772 TaxID=2590775 RepID=UPI0011320EBF|nr:hypothetical protein [Pseudarthrobacter sp. NIBRBAC000502772]QDG68114.1 hypothetical protein NIBR502772_19595 [Pseudarthrobacter sp. NIBRBAC000502772]